MAKTDYFPRREPELVNWLKNFTAKLAEHAKTLGITDAEARTLATTAGNVADEIVKTEQFKKDMLEQTAIKDRVKAEGLKVIRDNVNRFKTHGGYNEAIGKNLGVVGIDSDFVPDTFTTELTAKVFPGQVRIEFTKKGVDGINIYVRKKGEGQWRFLARDTRSPYIDTAPAESGTETREYRAMGVIDDAEIGQASDVVSAVWES